jgi:hypothetical protein
MQFRDFQNQLSACPVFSLQDVRKVFTGFSYCQLNRRGKKGYLKKIKKGFYYFTREIRKKYCSLGNLWNGIFKMFNIIMNKPLFTMQDIKYSANDAIFIKYAKKTA